MLLYFAFFNNGQLFYGGGVFRCFAYFLIMLQGAIMGKSAAKYEFRKIHVALFVLSICLFYAVLFVGSKNALMLLSFVALLGVTRYGYFCCCAPILKKLYQNRWLGNVVYIISQCCLEVYLIQKYVFTANFNHLFPLNIPVIMIAVLLMAYIVKTISEFISQTFKTEPYNWGKMILRKRDNG